MPGRRGIRAPLRGLDDLREFPTVVAVDYSGHRSLPIDG